MLGLGVKSLLLSDEVTLCGRHDWLEGGLRLSLRESLRKV